MEIADIQRVIEEFIKRLQLPQSSYELTTNTDNTFVELNIVLGDELQYCLSIDNGSLRVLYSTNYSSDNYYTQTFTSPITLLYQLCVIFFSVIHESTEMSFNDLLSVVLFNEVTNWKELAVAIAENVGLSAHTENEEVFVEDVAITYDNSIGCLRFGDNDFRIEKDSYSSLCESIFTVVEYIANLTNKADNLFDIESNIIEEPEVEENPEENVSIGDVDIDMDIDADMDSLLSDDESIDNVEPMDNVDFSEPVGSVVTPEDIQ